ncbi:MAG TPA: hypothetical protein VHM91_02050 [Verrucomicrobiales bacterium]|nr:hypothetical protein [Verrucomicrobiales bacterium]
MRPIWSRLGLLILPGVFLFSAGNYTRYAVRYAGVEEWPSVPATVTGQTGEELRFTQGRGNWTVDTREVQFDYVVNGKAYKGTEYSPNGGGLERAMDAEWRAYYNPDAPEVAVLNPVAYEGMGWLAWGGITGFMVTVQLFCAALDFRDRRRLARKARRRESYKERLKERRMHRP